MATEADRVLPCETGGVLLGYWAHPFSEAVVTAIVGPGPAAIHEPTRFVPDADYQEGEIVRWHLADPGRHGYLGDWHSHPYGKSRLSLKDRQTMLEIATHEAAQAPVPLMAVMTLEPDWQVSVWRFQSWPIRFLGYCGRLSLLRVQTFRQEGPGTKVRPIPHDALPL